MMVNKQKLVLGYKSVTDSLMSGHGNCKWKIGEWKKCDGDLILCSNGFHACRHPFDAFKYMQGNRFFLVEARGKILEGSDKFVASEMRLKSEVKDLERICVEFSIWSARRCLPNFEKAFPNDNRSRKAIEAAEEWLKTETLAARSAASAARSAASMAWSAASAASADSAVSAVSAVSAASSAASMAWSADSAAWSAASAARSAASAASAAWSAASTAWSADSAAWSAASTAWSADSAAWSAASAASADSAVSAVSAASAASSAAKKKLLQLIKKQTKEVE